MTGNESTASRPLPSYAYADLAFLGGNLVTLNPDRPRASAIAVRDGRILAVGSDADISPLIGPATEVHRLAGVDFPHIAR